MSNIKLLDISNVIAKKSQRTCNCAVAMISNNFNESLRRRGFSANTYSQIRMLNNSDLVGHRITVNGHHVANVSWLEQYKDGSVYMGMTIIDVDTFQKHVMDGSCCYVGIAWTFTMVIGDGSSWKYSIDSVTFVENPHFIGAGKVEWC